MNNSASAPEVAVTGAAGFLGQRLCAHLRKKGYNVTGICRPYATFLLERLGIPALPSSRIDGSRKFGLVINLAYPTRGLEHSRQQQNREIESLLHRLILPGGRLVHTSTLAVFGFSLDTPPDLGPVAMRPDYEYCVSKIAMEHALANYAQKHDVHIVRLGNVWGAGSLHWTAGLIHRLRAGLPVAVRGKAGFSNATEAGNACDYLEFLLTQPPAAGLHFHHLAEFAHIRWNEFVTFLAGRLGVSPVVADSHPTVRSTRVQDLRHALRHLSVGRVINDVMRSRSLGADARSIVARLPKGLLASVKRRTALPQFTLLPTESADDGGFCTVMACETRFPHSTNAAWIPPISLSESFSQVEEWMQDAAHIEEERHSLTDAVN
jgi:nucleoside-diphosphate-sugar epimerase